MKLAPAAIVLALLLSGCSSAAAAPASLKVTCESVNALWAGINQGSSDVSKLGDLLPKLRAISDAGDATSREALAPVLAAVEKVGDGSNKEAVGAMVAAYVPFLTQCGMSGASLATPSASTSASTSSAPSATTDAAPCGLVSDSVVKAILGDSGRTAMKSASLRGGGSLRLVALKLRSGEVGVWAVDSITDAATVLSADVKAKDISGWGMASTDETGPSSSIEAARACVA